MSPGSSSGSPVIHKKRSHSNDIFKGKTSPLKIRSKTLLSKFDETLKENQEAYDHMMWKVKEEKKRQPSFLMTLRGGILGEKLDMKKCGNVFDAESASRGISSLFGKKLKI